MSDVNTPRGTTSTSEELTAFQRAVESAVSGSANDQCRLNGVLTLYGTLRQVLNLKDEETMPDNCIKLACFLLKMRDAKTPERLEQLASEIRHDKSQGVFCDQGLEVLKMEYQKAKGRINDPSGKLAQERANESN